MNQIILQGLRTKLGETKENKTEELPGVLWAYHITPLTPTNETPFNLVFGIEIVILIEIELLIMQVEYFNESSSSS